MTKVRGITLNFKPALPIDFDTVKQIVDNLNKVVTTENSVVRRNKKKTLLLTTTESKEYKLVFDKRVIKILTRLYHMATSINRSDAQRMAIYFADVEVSTCILVQFAICCSLRLTH